MTNLPTCAPGADHIWEEQTQMVNDALNGEFFNVGDIRNPIPTKPPIISWIAVSGALGWLLDIEGEKVLRNAYGAWWGRTSNTPWEDDPALRRCFQGLQTMTA